MIGYLEGNIITSDTKTVTIKAGAVGYKIFVTNEAMRSTREKKGSVGFFTHLAVRENALDLFGFLSKEECDFFELLITIPGIGPRSALAVLNSVPVPTLKKAIGENNVSYLTKVSGIGKKTADKIILELRDKIGPEGNVSFLAYESDVLEALKSLGYREQEIREVLKKIPDSISDSGERVKEALKVLGKK